MRRSPGLTALLGVLTCAACADPAVAPGGLEVAEASIPELQAALEEGRTTSAQLVDLYLARIAAYDHAGPALNTIIRLNPRAREQAAALDAERAGGAVRGPLHGIPVLMKDNYDVAGMPTTGSSLALAGHMPPDDAFQVARLLGAGAVILGKTNLHELAAGITTISSLGGQTRNPYDPSRNPGGSSGGTGAAVAAQLLCRGVGVRHLWLHSDPRGGSQPVRAQGRPRGCRASTGFCRCRIHRIRGARWRARWPIWPLRWTPTVGMDPADPATSILGDRPPPGFVDVLDRGALTDARIGVIEEWVSGRRHRGKRDTRDSGCPRGDGDAGCDGDRRDDPRYGRSPRQHRADRLRLQVRPDRVPGRRSGRSGHVAGRHPRCRPASRGAGPHLPAPQRT